MLQLASSRAYVFIPVTGPSDPTGFAVQVALVTDNGTEPAPGDYHPAQWLAPRPGAALEAALLVGPGSGAVPYPPGEYMAYVTLAAGAEAPVIPSGRVRIGDARD